MLITFSEPTRAHVGEAAELAGRGQPPSYVSVDWKHATQCRCRLLLIDDQPAGKSEPASSKAHEAFIRAILEQDPRATIKTARAMYQGLEDYRKQKRR